jgi:hypothetical protein
LLPLLYLVLPLWLAAAFLLLAALSLLYFAWEPVLRARWAIWLATLGLLALDVAATFFVGTSQNTFLAVNNTLLLLLMVVGATNLWVQSGMKERDAALLGVFLALYDFIATARLPLMGDMVTRLSGLPVAPLVAWSGEHTLWGIGLGDLLLAAVFPLVMRKAFGRSAGLAALLLALAAIGILLALSLRGYFPVMVVLGPLMVVQYLYWRKLRGRERTTWQYLQEEPLEPRRSSLTPQQETLEPPIHLGRASLLARASSSLFPQQVRRTGRAAALLASSPNTSHDRTTIARCYRSQ